MSAAGCDLAPAGPYVHPQATLHAGPVLGPEALVGSFLGVHQELPDGHGARAPLQHAAALGQRHHLMEEGKINELRLRF